MEAPLIPVNATSNTSNTSNTTTNIIGVSATEIRVFFALIGVLSIVNNGALCIVLVRNQLMTKKSYNLMMLTLAVVDTLTGSVIVTSPSLVLGNSIWPVPAGIQGEIFCRLIQNSFIVKLLGKFSVTVVMAMTIERWYAIARPVQYKLVYTRRNVYTQLVSLLVSSLAVLAPQFFTAHLEEKNSKRICVDTVLMGNMIVDEVYTIMYSIVTVFIPLLVICTVYLHLRLLVLVQQRSQSYAKMHRRCLEIRLLRMNAAVAIGIGVCFSPSQICLILLRFGLVNDYVLRASAVCIMLNSIINPWIYCFTNSNFRRQFTHLLCPCTRQNVTPIITSQSCGTSSRNEATFQLGTFKIQDTRSVSPTYSNELLRA